MAVTHVGCIGSAEKEYPSLLFVNAPMVGKKPSFTGAPMSLLAAISELSGEIENGKFLGGKKPEIRIFDPMVLDEKVVFEFKQLLRELKPKLIGFSNTSAAHLNALKMAKIAREVSPDSIIVFGGAHELHCAQMTVERNPQVDIAVKGRGAIALKQIAEAVISNPRKRVEELAPILEKVEGAVFRINGGVVAAAPRVEREQIRFLLPRHLLEERAEYTYPIFEGKKTAQVMVSDGGCRFSCIFCSSHKEVNFREVEDVVAELNELAWNGYNAIFFDDSTFTVNRQLVLDLCTRMQEEKLGFEWGCQTRVDCVDRELLQEMAKAGCSYVYFGVECLDQHVLDVARKGFAAGRVDEAIKLVSGCGVRVGISLIFGLPGESDESIAKTMRVIGEHVKAGRVVCVSMNLATYYPGTQLSKEAGVDPAIFEQEPPNKGEPWERFEEGFWQHPERVAKEYAEGLLEKAKQFFGEAFAG